MLCLYSPQQLQLFILMTKIKMLTKTKVCFCYLKQIFMLCLCFMCFMVVTGHTFMLLCFFVYESFSERKFWDFADQFFDHTKLVVVQASKNYRQIHILAHILTKYVVLLYLCVCQVWKQPCRNNDF